MVDLQTDTMFLVPAVQFARLLLQASDRTDVFLYLFDHYPKLRDPSSPFKGTNHALEMVYLLDKSPIFVSSGMLDYTAIDEPSEEPVFDVFAGALSTFAKTGDPSRVRPNGQTVSWPRYDREQEYYLAIAGDPQTRTRLAAKRVALWTEFLPTMKK
ncbi:carboxylesterase 4A-like [Aplysia californica]|uniref:Carboxylesterase 4A-like n=1 Tax=Aplysia californica TaxID=6500 RepID=A0ABM1A087_APLCA|nr:carboxylesterase 4A-like [Aplysia californica]